MSKTRRAPDAPRKYERVIDLYDSWPAVSQRESFIRFWTGGDCCLRGREGKPEGCCSGGFC